MSNVSKKFIFLILVGALLGAFSAQAAEQVSGKIFYTTANIWYESKSQIDSTNYHKGAVLPLGTKVKIKEVFDGSTSVSDPMGTQIFDRFIRFDDATGESYKFFFLPRYAKPGMTVWDLFKQYFAENNPMDKGGAFGSLTVEDQKSVMAGVIAVGMSKTAVVMAYGYPPSHRKPSLLQDKWTYWESRSKTRTVYFSEDKVINESDAGKEARRIKTLSPMEECMKTCKENTKRSSEQCFDACNHSW
ncbi:MAG: hypothetical protein A2X58_00695 [Nitrospirae bacterium GWC2_56_14]|nr:MAG: hypothetical protein A2X58_00695 [Nitrospirae bacterium GWC2_56_14]